MKVIFDQRLDRDGYDVYMYEESTQGRFSYRVEDGGLQLSEPPMPPGAALVPTLFLQRRELDVLRTALIGEAVDSDDALRDARTVRDRLLTMIEQEWSSRQHDAP